MVPRPLPQGLSDLPEPLARRVRIGLSGSDCDAIPKVAHAGQCFDTPEGPIQLMHNGVRVRLGGYHGDWMARLIAGLRGHHEPQEEKVFHELVPRVRRGGTMIEMGAFWAYYSLWFAAVVPGARNIVVEPDAAHLDVARDNFRLNRRDATFLQAGCSDRSGMLGSMSVISVDDLVQQLQLDYIDVLHADIQGAELRLLQGMSRVIRENRVRFVFLSTHHHSISGDPEIHAKCLQFLRQHSAHLLAEHTVEESCSGDGLIVASFAAEDRSLPAIPLTPNRSGESLFAPTVPTSPKPESISMKEVPMSALKSLYSNIKQTVKRLIGSGLNEQLHALRQRVESLQAELAATTRATQALSRSARSRAVIRGHVMQLNPEDAIVSRALSETGGFEWFETELVEQEVRPGDTVLDLGANIGYYTLLFARLVGPRGRVIAFEPDPVNFNLLKRNVRLNGYRNVEIVNKAVTDFTGELELHLSPTNHGDHRLYNSGDGRATVKVATTTIDDYFNGVPPKVDLVKMDIQGSEAKAIHGMTRTLQQNHSVKLITEFWPIGLHRAGADAAEYLQKLQQLGFSISEIHEGEECLLPVDPVELLKTYTIEKANFTNLFCTRKS